MLDLVRNPEDLFSRDADQAEFSRSSALYEPHREKTGVLPMRKQRRRSASQ